jgi:hypothetical protein
MKILHYGLQRSGTNYFEALLSGSFPDLTWTNHDQRDHPAHKHFRAYDEKHLIAHPLFYNDFHFEDFADFERQLGPANQADHYFVISKDPYSWLLSYRRWARKNGWPRPAFHYLEEYQAFYRWWLQQWERHPQRIHHLRYVDLLRSPAAAMEEVSSWLDHPYQPPSAIRKVSFSRRFSARKKQRYLDQQYLKKLRRQDWKVLEEVLDPALLAKLGYELAVRPSVPLLSL